jgi:hypothetical protein
MSLPSTKPEDPAPLLEAGPRALVDLPKMFRLELAKSSALGPYREAAKSLSQAELAEIHREIEFVSKQNREIEKTAHHTRSHYPESRIPMSMWIKMEDIYGKGCWEDHDFMQDTLQCHPGLRIRIKYGVRGQELLRK